MRALLLVSLLCLALITQAAERQRAGSFSTSRGHSGTYQTQVSGERGAGLNRQRSITGANGQTYTHSSTSTYDKASNTLNRTVTGSQGNTRSGSITVTPNP
ncbi:MAG: hypothetical protein AAGC84_18065 [Pseudomonas sp.]